MNRSRKLSQGNPIKTKISRAGIVIIAAVLMFAVAFSSTMLLQPMPHHASALPSNNINITGIASVFNVVGYRYFDNGGYLIFSDINASRFRESGSALFVNSSKMSALGSSSFSESMTAFIFNGSSLPTKYSMDSSIIKSYFSSSGNASVTEAESFLANGSTISIYTVNTMVSGTNGAVAFTDYGSVFSYRNVLFIGYFQGLGRCINASSYLAAYLHKSD